MAQLRDNLKYPVKQLSRSLINPQDQDVKNLIHLLKYVNQNIDFVFVMEPQLAVRNQHSKFPVQIVSNSDSDWATCQKSVKEVNKWFTGFSTQCQSSVTSRTQASIAHSSAESELYAMTQAVVESLAIILTSFKISKVSIGKVSIGIQTDSSARNSMAPRLGISRRSKNIELKYLWTQDEVKEGKLELKKVGTHFTPSDALTKYVPTSSVLGQHLPHLNIFKVIFQRFSRNKAVNLHVLLQQQL